MFWYFISKYFFYFNKNYIKIIFQLLIHLSKQQNKIITYKKILKWNKLKNQKLQFQELLGLWELVRELCESGNWQEVTVIVRRSLEPWQQYVTNNQLKVIQVDNLDGLEKTQDWQQFNGYNTMFCCLGGRVKMGDDVFKKIDYTYPLWGAQIAKANKIPHYGLVTSQGASSTSWFLYMKVKGQVEAAIKDVQIPLYSIYRPGAIINRQNDDRFGEKVLQFIPFISKIESKDLAKSLRIEAERVHQNKQQNLQSPSTTILENKDLLNLLK